MAANFYYKQSNVTVDDIYTNSRLRNNAFVTITSTSGFRLPITATSFSETYNPEGTGRAAPILKDVKISLTGEAASLRKAEVSFTCFDMTSFEEAERALLIPGSEVTIKYGYVGPETPSQTGEYVFRVYDYSFSITKQNYFECSFKAVAKGTGAEFDLIDISGTDKFAKGDAAKPLEYITNYDWGNEKARVQTIFDYIDYVVQQKTGEANNWDFDPDHGFCAKLPDGGHCGIIVAPDEYEPTTQINPGKNIKDRIVYITLESLVAIVNKYILAGNENNYQIKFNNTYSAIDIVFPAGRIFSPSPYKTLFPYVKGTLENHYYPQILTAQGYKSTEGNPFISCESFANFDSDIYEEFRIDKNVLPVGVRAAGGVTTGSPKGILLSRDVLREIQSTFDQSALNEDQSTEDTEKANAKIDLASFFKKVFAVIRDNSGGDWSLTLDVDEDLNDGTIWIVNKKAPVKETVRPLVLSPTGGVNGVRELKLSGAVPQDIQAEAFGGAPSTQKVAKDIIAGTYDIEAELQRAEFEFQESVTRLRKEVPEAQAKINFLEYSLDSVTAAKTLIKELVETLSPDGLAERNKILEPTPYPLEVEIVVDGTEGFRFGDTITSDYLPSRYRLETGARVVFTVTQYTHTIKGNDWQTSLSCISRIVKDD